MSRSSFIGHVLPLVVSIAAIACSSSTTTDNGSGGKGSGGVSSSGGTGSGGVGSGGTQPGVGGKSGTGGAATGGTLATGGTSSAATGGVIGKGGVTGAGGTSGEGGGAGSTNPRDGGPGLGGRTAGDGGPGRDGGAPGGRTGGGSGGQVGGSTGTTPTGGSTGGGSFCKASPCVILPLGDSITHGLNSSDSAGYRSQLFKLAVAANQNITFIGSQSSGPSTVSGKTFPKNHEGHDGITITGITGDVPPAKALTGTPHIVLVHIGTNDMTSNADPTTAAKQLDTLVTNLVGAAPGALIVVAKIVPLGYSNSNYTSYIGKIQDVVKTHAASNVVMVDMSTLPSSDIAGNGNVHPTDKGYSDMANLWYGAIKDYLPQ